MIVYVIRHAWAEKPDSSRWPDDSQRPLTEEGRRRFRRFARRLVKRGLNIRLIGTSPYLRCVETAEILMSATRETVCVEAVPALSPQGSFDELMDWLQKHASDPKQNIALVGHAPDVGELISRLVGGGKFDCAKGSVAAIEFKEQPKPGEGELLFLVTAGLLKC